MDLAEIRKKARTINPEPQPRPVERGAACANAPAPPVPVASPEPMESQRDPLAALFETPPGITLATEESYLQGLRGEKEHTTESRRWLAFLLGNEEYALDIGDIIEIIKPREITDIPRVPEFILGVISLRGVLITILDLNKRLHLGGTELTPESRIIVCQRGERMAGLLVDSLTHVVTMPVEHIEPPPAMLSGLDRELVAGVGRHHGRMMILLQLSSVLDAELV
jgi:purine-binding chemotaxis protein CheW